MTLFEGIWLYASHNHENKYMYNPTENTFKINNWAWTQHALEWKFQL